MIHRWLVLAAVTPATPAAFADRAVTGSVVNDATGVRGTAPRDTKVYLDDIEVPLLYHFGGIASFVPTGAVDEVTLEPGGASVRYGRGLGGVAIVTSRTGRGDDWRVGGELSLISAGALAEGPGPLKGSWLVGVRRSYFDALIGAAGVDLVLVPRYGDAQLRWESGDGRWMAILFGSDPDPDPDPAADPAAARLRLLDDRLFDTVLGADCRPRSIRGVIRCLPVAITTATLVFTAGCTSPVLVAEVPQHACQPPAYATSNRPFTIRPVGDRAPGPLFRLDGTTCTPYAGAPGNELRALGAPIDPTIFLGAIDYGERSL